MATERTLVHYSKQRLSQLKNSTVNQAKIAAIHGKPVGFWYAYGEDWKQLVNAEKAGRNSSTTAFRYEFVLPEDAFTTTIHTATANTIFELSRSNLDAFMKKFVKKTYRYSANDMLEHAFTTMVMDGESAVLNEIIKTDDEFAYFCDTLLDDNDVDVKKVMKKVKKMFPRIVSEFSPSQKALASDNTSSFNWPLFWNDVSKVIGGVEFHTDLFDITEWDNVWLPWTSKLDIRSGVIFHPSTFRSGVLMEQLRKSGGKRQTRRKRAVRRHTQKH